MAKSALIFWGGWEGHTPERSAAIVKAMLENNGFTVRMEAGTSCLTDPALGKLDLIVPVITMTTIQKDELQNLTQAVRQPRLRARLTRSSARRVFPIPGSPASISTDGRPCDSASSRSSNTARCASRPTISPGASGTVLCSIATR